MTSLADIERAVAHRVGPYFTATQDTSRSGQARSAYFPELQSGLTLGEPENLWLLRRAPSVADYDRQRLVQAYDPTSGTIITERNWQQPPAIGEVCEFHHLNPSGELRPSVLAGLRRCWLSERFLLNCVDPEVDVTAQAPWITGTAQVVDLQYSYPVGPHAYSSIPFEVMQQQGHVIVAAGGFVLNGAILTARRPANTLVNGLDASNPTDDDDDLSVDLDYAAAAGHIEAWHNFPARLASAAAGGSQASQSMAALEMSRQAAIWAPYSRGHYAFRQPFGLAAMASAAR
jgi:hypothetical protein